MSENDYVAGNPQLDGSEHLVVISGCSGGGKSTLLAEMKRRGYSIRPEPGRQIVKEQIYVNGDAVPWNDVQKFIELCVSRSVFFYNSVEPSCGYVLFDRSVVDAVAAFGRFGLPTPDHFTNTVRLYRYAPVVFMIPPWEALFASDAERRHGFDDAVAEYQALLACYPANGYEVVVVPKVGVAERADFLEARLGRGRSG